MENEAQTAQAQEQAPEPVRVEVTAEGLKSASEFSKFEEKAKETLTGVAQKIAAEYKEAKGEVVKVAEKLVVELESADKLAISQIENQFLKVQLELHQHSAEINRLQNLAKEIQTKFETDTKALYKKYAVSLETHILDAVAFVFKKKNPVPEQNKQ